MPLWQIGDLAMSLHSSWKDVREGELPPCLGKIYRVTQVDDLGDGRFALRFCNTSRCSPRYTWLATAFCKVTPQHADSFDDWVIKRMTGMSQTDGKAAKS